MKKRFKYLIVFITIFIIECLIAIFLKKGFIRENVGDILVIPCIYTFLRTIIPNKIKYLSIDVLLFSIIVEFLQMFNITTLLANNNKILRIAFGGTFDIKDILCYTVGYLIIIIVINLFKKKKQPEKNWSFCDF